MLEVARAVGLGPQPDPARHRRTQYRIVDGEEIWIRRSFLARYRFRAERVLDGRRAVQPRLQARAVDCQFQLMPSRAIQHERLRPVAESDIAADAVVKLPERDVVLRVVVAYGQPVAIGLHVEEDSRAAVAIAR